MKRLLVTFEVELTEKQLNMLYEMSQVCGYPAAIVIGKQDIVERYLADKGREEVDYLEERYREVTGKDVT